MGNFAINGFGRIGKCILRAFLEGNYNSLKCLVVNAGFGNLADILHLFKYDSIHRKMEDIQILDDSHASINGHTIKFIFDPNPENINWIDLGVEVVLECTGNFTKKSLAQRHINAGAKKVIVSAPCEDADATIVYGVNENALSKKHSIISIGSCTTNCLAPIAKIINDFIGIESGFMTTIHAYTNDQNLLDGSHSDLRRARAAALSMIPSSTGAAKALGIVIPELVGKLDGVAVRVPVPNVSMIDLVFTAHRTTTIEELNNKIRLAAHSNMKNVLQYLDEPLVSIDFIHNTASCIFDATQTRIVNNNLYRVVAWYDNEWGFSNRMLDVLKLL